MRTQLQGVSSSVWPVVATLDVEGQGLRVGGALALHAQLDAARPAVHFDSCGRMSVEAEQEALSLRSASAITIDDVHAYGVDLTAGAGRRDGMLHGLD